MEGPYVRFSLLKAGRGVQRVVARLLRFWCAQNIKKGGELMGVDILLIDGSSTIMQGTIHVHHLAKFEPLLHEGSIYVITGFEVTRSNHRFKLTDFHLSIRFNEGTSFVQLEESFCKIPNELFRFRSYDQLLALGNTNNELPDIIGEVCTTKAYRNEATNVLERIMVHLRLEGGEKVRISAFDAQANSLHQIFSRREAGTCVMLATNINPKFFGGELYLNATSGTRFYFDGDVKATRCFVHRSTINNSEDGKTTAKYQGVQKIEHVTIAELNEFLTTSNLEDAEFLCSAAVVGILSTNGWSYISCSKCSKKMSKNETALTCNNCFASDAVGDVKYRVEMVVDDGSGSSVFVAFDKDMVCLTNMQAGHLATEIDDRTADPENDTLIPQQIRDI